MSPVLEERKVLTTGPPESPFDLSVLFLTPETGQGNQTGFNFLRTLESFLIKSSGKASPFSMCPQWTAFISQLPRSPGLSGCSGMTLSVCFLQRLTKAEEEEMGLEVRKCVHSHPTSHGKGSNLVIQTLLEHCHCIPWSLQVAATCLQPLESSSRDRCPCHRRPARTCYGSQQMPGEPGGGREERQEQAACPQRPWSSGHKHGKSTSHPVLRAKNHAWGPSLSEEQLDSLAHLLLEVLEAGRLDKERLFTAVPGRLYSSVHSMDIYCMPGLRMNGEQGTPSKI